MSLTAGQVQLAASINYAQTRPQAGLPTATQAPAKVAYKFAPDVTIYKQALVATYTIAAAGTQNVDFSSFQTLLYELITNANKVRGFIITGTAAATGAKMKLTPAATNGLVWFFGTATDSITLSVGTAGCSLFLCDGADAVIDATHKVLVISNPGTVSLTVNIAALVGTP